MDTHASTSRPCLRCGYDLQNHAAGRRCPECGSDSPSEDPIDHARVQSRRTRRIQAALAFAAVIALFALLCWMIAHAG